MYAKFLKRPIDLFLSLCAVLALSPAFIVLTILGAIKMKGNPFFSQLRPGRKDKDGNEKIFKLIKFRTMTNERDKQGKLLPDEKRLTAYGEFLRKTSLDELPELFNILKGDMSIIGPRPQLVRDMVFMTSEQRNRHDVRPGLSGLAQINGRNCIEWEDKLNYDLEYIKKISFTEDFRIIFTTIIKVFKTESISYEGMATAEDFGDYLLRTKKVDKDTYDKNQLKAKELIENL